MASNRISQAMLENLCKRINTKLGRPLEPWSKDENGKFKANLGNFHISGAYGGVRLHEMMTEGGGIKNVFGCGYVTKRELWEKMQAFLSGLEY